MFEKKDDTLSPTYPFEGKKKGTHRRELASWLAALLACWLARRLESVRSVIVLMCVIVFRRRFCYCVPALA